VHRDGLPPDIDRTWILTNNDKAVPANQQRRNITNLGDVNRVIEIAAGHDVMVSQPTELAAVIMSCWTPAES
jgi:hypothetical protein